MGFLQADVLAWFLRVIILLLMYFLFAYIWGNCVYLSFGEDELLFPLIYENCTCDINTKWKRLKKNKKLQTQLQRYILTFQEKIP